MKTPTKRRPHGSQKSRLAPLIDTGQPVECASEWDARILQRIGRQSGLRLRYRKEGERFWVRIGQ